MNRELRQLAGVIGAHISGGEDQLGTIELVLAPGVSASEVVETARRQISDKFAISISAADIRVTSVATDQAVSTPAAATVGPESRGETSRVRIDNVAVTSRDLRTEARVSLWWGGQQWEGVREGPNTTRRRCTLIAEATLAGLEEILGEPGLFSLEDMKLVDMLEEPVAVVALELTARRRGQRLTGSCSAASAHGSIDEAVVRATLQAVNRLFGTFATGAPPA